MASDRVEGLRRALDATPDNHALRLLLAETLADDGDAAAAVKEYDRLFAEGQLPAESLLEAGRAALEAGRQDRAQAFADAASENGLVEEASDLKSEIDASLGLKGWCRCSGRAAASTPPATRRPRSSSSTRIARSRSRTSAASTTSRRRSTARSPSRTSGTTSTRSTSAAPAAACCSSVLPGAARRCSRATAGECGLPFSNVRIEEILDPCFGVSEQKLHDAFVQARRFAPCVLFLDELDAIDFARRKHTSNVGRPVVDQLLQKLDAIGADNEGVLVLAATNAPWDVDEAMKRPGRFDRMVFVPPPDEPARARILELQLEGRPASGVDVKRIANKTPLFSGADLRALAERRRPRHRRSPREREGARALDRRPRDGAEGNAAVDARMVVDRAQLRRLRTGGAATTRSRRSWCRAK